MVAVYGVTQSRTRLRQQRSNMTCVLTKQRSLDTHTCKERTPYEDEGRGEEERPRNKSRNTRKAPEARGE